uniref:Uncharacterized protein n=1 Tax=viral metagenome TaxID=1070528 RepID=A0A6C0D0J2_9ZZZZ
MFFDPCFIFSIYFILFYLILCITEENVNPVKNPIVHNRNKSCLGGKDPWEKNRTEGKQIFKPRR